MSASRKRSKTLVRWVAALGGARRARVPAGSISLIAAAIAGAAAASLNCPAQATLGEDVKTVELDRRQIDATTQVRSYGTFTVHELHSAAGAVVREYVSPAGTVFGISWSGPSIPNLRQLLGTYAATFASSTHRQLGGRGHLGVREGNLVVESNGRMRSFHGRAYLSDQLPPGVTIDDVQ